VPLLLLGQLSLLLQGCMSVRATGSVPAAGEGGGVSAVVYADDAARRAGQPGPGGVLGELDRREGRGWAPVFRSLRPAWTVAGLAPGAYRVRFPARLDDAGNVVRIDEKPVNVKVVEGRIAKVEAVLDHVSPGLVVVGAVTVVVAVVLLSKFLEHHDLPEPPPPPPGLVKAVFYVTFDFAPVWQGVSDRAAPVATSHFPAAGALVAARRPRVVFSFTEPLSPPSLQGDAVTVLGESAGLVPGVVSYDAEHWWVVWQPAADLPGGDTFHVTLRADGVEDTAGNELKEAASFSFKTAK
jgi:hypothetical protein